MTVRRLRPVGIAVDEYEDEEQVRYCAQCLAVGILSILKERLYLDEKGKKVPCHLMQRISYSTGSVGSLFQ
jgi:hypothetical protein